MKKEEKKSANWLMIAAALVALLSLVSVAYAQKDSVDKISRNNMMDMMSGKEMGLMHKQMTKNLEPGLRNQMDKMHKSCIKGMKNDGDDDEFKMGVM
ncbi:MAG TPA: hypothetical protein VI564_05075 [Candidatus Nanoarchaeia archaeon]|nr:hypothetical protein [Candidatus Nanoarchaeia archaeon]